MIKYSDVTDKVVYYKPYIGSAVLEGNATPSFTLINLKSDDVARYCCKVNTKVTGGSHGDVHSSCTHLKLLGKAFSPRCMSLKAASATIYLEIAGVTIIS